MPILKNSRGKFFHVHKMPSDRAFWLHFFDRMGKMNLVPHHHRRALESWKPERSNCPELTYMIEGFIARIPGEWQATARNLFVGRVMAADINAKAWTERQAGIIEINLQYTWALSAYVTTFDEVLGTLRHLLNNATEGAELETDQLLENLNRRLRHPWEQLDLSRAQWRDPRLLGSGDISLLEATAPERIGLQAEVVSACEEFILAHELAHHLLGHLSKHPGKGNARKVVTDLLDRSDLLGLRTKLNTNQKQEIDADVLAFALVADCIERAPTHEGLYRAILASIISLVTLAHVQDSWFEIEPEASHPGFLERFTALTKLTKLLATGMPIGPSGDHPLDALAQLQTFAGIAYTSWANKNAVPPAKQLGILSIANFLMDRREQLMQEISTD
ncbi:hypothetical protein [Polymorphospora lycopeni]|uniref:Peptidase M48 domain-containing protein n=1 Tax=Polymorphospora lycopeni TaxID=3140240 RepID=A0ABV5D135_9ACTN